MGAVMRLRRPTRALRVAISDRCLSRQVLWPARGAISWVLNPSVSRILIRICCATLNCGAMITAGTKALTLARREEEEKGWEEVWALGASGQPVLALLGIATLVPPATSVSRKATQATGLPRGS